MFSHITKNWRGRPLTSHEVIVNLIANTTNGTGLNINAAQDSGEYLTGIKIPDQAIKGLKLEKHEFHGGMELFDSSTVKPMSYLFTLTNMCP